MLPDFLVGTYRQYKEDTKTIAVWLASTAASYGYNSSTDGDDQSEQTTKKNTKSKAKSKPKTKKQLRDAARRNPGYQRKIVLQITDFVPLAEYVSQHIKAPARVPQSILAIIKRVIGAREEAQAWFKNSNTTENTEGGHSHFVGILRTVHKILQPHTVVDDASDDEELTLVENVYENLTLEEPSEKFLQAPGTQPTTRNPIDRLLYEFADAFVGYLEGYLESSFAATAFFKDVNNIYQQAEQIWHQYRDGKVDLMTASLTSNTAIDLIRQLEDDFFTQFPRFRNIDHRFLKQFKRYDSNHKDAQQLINVMFRARCASKDMDSGNVNKQDDEEQATFNFKMYDEAQYLFLDMLEIMCRYVVNSQKMSKICWTPAQIGQWDPDRDHSKMSNKDKHLDNARILAELLPDMWLLSTSTTTPLAEDELLKGCRNLTDANGGQSHFHVWSLAAARLFCDVHHILGASIWKPFDTVQRLGKDALDTMNSAIAARDRGEASCWPPKVDQQIKENLTDKIQSWLFEDELKAEIMHAARNVKGYKKPDHHLFRRFPLLCGLFEFNIRTGMQEMGLFTQEHFNAGAMLAHLYNAVQQEGFCQAQWQDMNDFIELQTVERLFVGGKPKNPDEYFKRIALYQGASPEVFAHNRRKTGMIVSKNGPRSLVPSGGVINLFKWRHGFHCDSERSATALTALEKGLDSDYELTRSGAATVTVRPRGTAEATDRKNKNAYKNSKYTPVELLIVTQFALSRDVPDLRFDFFFLHKCGTTILRYIHEMLNPEFERTFQPGYLGDDNNFPGLIAYILCIGVPIKQVSSSSRRSFPSSICFRLASRVSTISEQYSRKLAASFKTRSRTADFIRRLTPRYGR